MVRYGIGSMRDVEKNCVVSKKTLQSELMEEKCSKRKIDYERFTIRTRFI